MRLPSFFHLHDQDADFTKRMDFAHPGAGFHERGVLCTAVGDLFQMQGTFFVLLLYQWPDMLKNVFVIGNTLPFGQGHGWCTVADRGGVLFGIVHVALLQMDTVFGGQGGANFIGG